MADPMMSTARKMAEVFGYDPDQFETGLGVVKENPFSLFRGALGAVKENPLEMAALATPWGRAFNLGSAGVRSAYDLAFGEDEAQAAQGPQTTPLAPPPDRAGLEAAIASLRGDVGRVRSDEARMNPGFSRTGKGYEETPGLTRTDIISAQERADAFRRRALGPQPGEDDKKTNLAMSKAESENARSMGEELNRSEAASKTERLRAVIEKMKGGETNGKEKTDRITTFQKTYMKALEGQTLPEDPEQRQRAIFQTMKQFSGILQPEEFQQELINAGLISDSQEGPAQQGPQSEPLSSDEEGSGGYMTSAGIAALALLSGTAKGRALLKASSGKLKGLFGGKAPAAVESLAKATKGSVKSGGGSRVPLDEFFKGKKPLLGLPAPAEKGFTLGAGSQTPKVDANSLRQMVRENKIQEILDGFKKNRMPLGLPAPAEKSAMQLYAERMRGR